MIIRIIERQWRSWKDGTPLIAGEGDLPEGTK
jgi:hypothetical protein